MAWQEIIPNSRIDPHVRPPKEPVRFDSARDAFDAGNYPVALDMARFSDPAYYALSMIMGGNISRGLTLLEGLPALPQGTQNVRAYARWCLGQNTGMAAGFQKQPECPIDILLITMPGAAKALPFDNVTEFNVRHLQMTPDDFGSTLKEFLNEEDDDFSPVLAVVIDCFGPYLPDDLFDSGIPVAVWVGDHDYFLPHRYDDLKRAHLLITNSASEHSELSSCYDGRVVAFPGHDTYIQLGPVNSAPADIEKDILFTGRAFVPYMRDKAQYLFRFATLDREDIRVSIFNGYFSEAIFSEKLRQSRAVPLFWRYGGGLQTRGVEVLSQGVVALSPETGICRDFLGPAAEAYQVIGAEALDPDLLTGKSRVGEPYPIDDLFWPSPAREERFLKFCLFHVSLGMGHRSLPSAQLHTPVEQRGYQESEGIAVYTRIMTLNMRAPETAAHFNAAGSAGFYGAILSQDNQKLAQLSLQLFREGVRQYPKNAAMAFNLARALWIFGVQKEARNVFGHLIENHQNLTFQASVDGLLSHRVRILSDMFNYTDYYRLSVEALQQPAVIMRILDALVSGAHTYLAAAHLLHDQPARALNNLERAVVLDRGNFAAHGLMVEALANVGDREEALLRSFFTAINLYPPLLLRYGGEGMSAALVLGRDDSAIDVLKKCILFFARTSDANGQPLNISDNTKSAMRKHRGRLSGWIREIADKLVAGGRL